MKKLILLIPTVLSLNGNDCAGIRDTVQRLHDRHEDFEGLVKNIDRLKDKRQKEFCDKTAKDELKRILQEIGAHFDKKELSTIFGLMVAEQAASSASPPPPPPPPTPKIGTPPPPPPPPAKVTTKAKKQAAEEQAPAGQPAKKQAAGGRADLIAQLEARFAEMKKAMGEDEDQETKRAEAKVSKLQPDVQKEDEKLVLDLKKYKDQIDDLANVRLGATAKANFRKILEEMNKEYGIEAQFNEALGELKGYIDSSEHKHKAKLQETYQDWNKMS